QSGHCELFAGGLAAMARSLGMQARVVIGFLATEYNGYGGYYVVRQRDAHAWTEIYCGDKFGWLSFDSTPPAPVAAQHARVYHWYTPLRHLYGYLSFRWSSSITHYNAVARAKFLASLGGTDKSSKKSRTWLNNITSWFTKTFGLGKLSYLDY